MRILHTSDWHLGQYFYGKSRAPEHKQFMQWLLAQVTEYNVDAVIIAGDIFDTGSPPSYARELYFEFITKLHQLNCQLIVVAGNHDSTAMLAESKQLLKKLNTHVIPHTQIDLEQQVLLLNNKQGKPAVAICGIPYLRPKDIVISKANQSAKQKQKALQEAIAEHYQELVTHAHRLMATSNVSLPIIATGHLTTIGASTSDSVREIYIGTLEAFPASAFPDVDYIALGHIHQQQMVGKSEHIAYSGSPIPLSFDECKQQKKVMLAEFDHQGLTNLTALTVPYFQPMALLKTSLKNVVNDVDKLLETFELPHQKTNSISETFDQKIKSTSNVLWLDIEIDSGEYKQDIQTKIAECLTDKPVEILLVRRSKQVREKLLQQQEKITLDELTPKDVFNSRIEQEEMLEKEQTQRLCQLFQHYVDSAQTVLDATNEPLVK